jgi:hypothetical protein
MAKPLAVRPAMEENPNRVIIFLDVDCEVRGDLSPLAELASNVAFRVQTKRRRNGGIRFRVRSGTLALKPTEGARRFVDMWGAISATSQYGDVDQTTLMLTIGLTPGVTFTPLELKWCATAGDHAAHPMILHDSASFTVRKIGNWRQLAHQLSSVGRGRQLVGAPCTLLARCLPWRVSPLPAGAQPLGPEWP